MSGIDIDSSGFDDLLKQLKEIGAVVNSDQILDVIEVGTDQFVSDLMKLPKPMSQINKSGYTHLVRSFTSAREGGVIKVGWGKYYGRYVEHGTRKMSAQPHLVPMWERNQSKYVDAMRNAFWNKIK